jgi:nitroreductase
MDAVVALLTRVSPLRLGSESPEGAALDNILNAGLRAPDHGRLRPWKFLLVRGEARNRFGTVLEEALRRREPAVTERVLQAEREKPLRAPLIVIVAASVREDSKVPAIEQQLCAGAAAQNMLIAAHAQGFGGFWRTGAPAYDAYVKEALGLKPADAIVGFLYLGNVAAQGPAKQPDASGVVKEWTGND